MGNLASRNFLIQLFLAKGTFCQLVTLQSCTELLPLLGVRMVFRYEKFI
jgi:hypothetical protein